MAHVKCLEAAKALDVQALEAAFVENAQATLFAVLWTHASAEKTRECVELILLKLKHHPVATATEAHSGKTALMVAVQTDQADVMQLLLSHQPLKLADLDLRCIDGQTALMYAAQLPTAECLTLLLGNGADTNVGDNQGWTAIVFAASCGMVCALRHLIAHDGCNVNHVTPYCGSTALMLAARHGKVMAVGMLIECDRVDINVANEIGDTALMIAVKGERVKVVKRLLTSESVEVNVQNTNNNTAMLIACRIGNIAIVNALLERTTIDLNLAGSDGHTALMWAVTSARLENVLALLAMRDADKNVVVRVNDKNMHGRHALLLASLKGDVAIVTALLAASADVTVTDTTSNNALSYAAHRGYTDVVRVLLAVKGHDGKRAVDLHQPNRNGFTPLLSAVVSGFVNCVDLILNAMETVAEERRALSVHVVGVPVLILAAQHGYCDVVDRLMACRMITLNAASGVHKRTALMTAAMLGNEGVVELLLRKPADKIGRNMKDLTGATALHLAVQNQNTDISLMLFRKDITVADTELLLLAAENNNTRICEVCIDIGVKFAAIPDQTMFATIMKVNHATLAVIAAAGSSLFGSGLRSFQLWVVCNLRLRVSRAETPLLHVTRQQVLEGVCEHLSIDHVTGRYTGANPRPLAVAFRGESAMGDGIRREWLDLACNELMHIDRGLCIDTANGRTCNPHSAVAVGEPHLAYFAMLGQLVGYSAYHCEPINARWSPAFLKAAFKFPVTAADFAAAWPIEHRTHIQLIQTYDANANDGKPICQYWEEELDLEPLSFAVTVNAPAYMHHKVHHLKDGGALVTDSASQHEYAELYMQHRMVRQIHQQLLAFQSGINVFFSPELLARLHEHATPEYLIQLLSHTAVNVHDWRESTVYKGGFKADSPQIQWFWAVVTAMTPAEQANVLTFCTGSSMAPATGMATIMAFGGTQAPFTVQKMAGNCNGLPTAQTCFNTLFLPAYPSKMTLQRKLTTALHLYEGSEDA